MAFSTAAVLYSFFRQVESPNEDLGLWKCVKLGRMSGGEISHVKFYVTVGITQHNFFINNHHNYKIHTLRSSKLFFVNDGPLVVVMMAVDQWKAFQLPYCVSDAKSLFRRRIV
jgi:hypothetical protein